MCSTFHNHKHSLWWAVYRYRPIIQTIIYQCHKKDRKILNLLRWYHQELLKSLQLKTLITPLGTLLIPCCLTTSNLQKLLPKTTQTTPDCLKVTILLWKLLPASLIFPILPNLLKVARETRQNQFRTTYSCQLATKTGICPLVWPLLPANQASVLHCKTTRIRQWVWIRINLRFMIRLTRTMTLCSCV